MTRDRVSIRPATAADVPLILTFIRELAEYEKLAHEVVASEADFHEALFGARPVIEAVIASIDAEPVTTAPTPFAHAIRKFAPRARKM